MPDAVEVVRLVAGCVLKLNSRDADVAHVVVPLSGSERLGE
jgi:hypothetical protein